MLEAGDKAKQRCAELNGDGKEAVYAQLFICRTSEQRYVIFIVLRPLYIGDLCYRDEIINVCKIKR